MAGRLLRVNWIRTNPEKWQQRAATFGRKFRGAAAEQTVAEYREKQENRPSKDMSVSQLSSGLQFCLNPQYPVRLGAAQRVLSEWLSKRPPTMFEV